MFMSSRSFDPLFCRSYTRPSPEINLVDCRTLVEPQAAVSQRYNRSWLSKQWPYVAVIVMILAIYSYPAVRTALTTRSLRMPAVSAPDLGLYLSLSKLQSNADGTIVNSFYRISVPASSVGYLKFRTGPILFGYLNHLFQSRLGFSLFVWNLLWWMFLSLSAIWLFNRFLPLPTPELVLAGVSALMLFSITEVGRLLSAPLHFSLSALPGGLAYIRPFAPQVMAPLLIVYLGLQIRALAEERVLCWFVMSAVQFAALTCFPYATLLMAGTSAVATVWYLLFSGRRSAWRFVVGFALLCALIDFAFAMHGSGGIRYGFPDQSSFIRLQPSLLAKSIGKFWVLTAILIVATVRNRTLRSEVKWTLVGMGLSNIVFVLGDAFIAERIFFLSDHMGYFYQSTVVIMLAFLVSAYLEEHPGWTDAARPFFLGIIGVCGLFGLLLAEGNYRRNFNHNQELSDLAHWAERSKLTSEDLVITKFVGSAYDSCEFVPLLSPAQVLYCRNAQLALTPEQNRDIQRHREILYLYFDGKDRAWVNDSTSFEGYGIYGEVSSYRNPEEQAARVSVLRREMLPLFQQVEDQDPAVRDFFHRFRHIWIVENSKDPLFVNARLNSYFDIQSQQNVGTLLVLFAVPK